MGFRSRRETVVWSVGLFVAFVFPLTASIMAFRTSVAAWSVTHGSGHPGTWVAVERYDGGRLVTWYGDFTASDGSPDHVYVRLDGLNADLKAGDSIHATYGGDPPRAYRGSLGWVIYSVSGSILAGISGLVGWLVLHHLRRPRRRDDRVGVAPIGTGSAGGSS
jgi:hypothetical protein